MGNQLVSMVTGLVLVVLLTLQSIGIFSSVHTTLVRVSANVIDKRARNRRNASRKKKHKKRKTKKSKRGSELQMTPVPNLNWNESMNPSVDWQEALDEASGRKYWYNSAGEVHWQNDTSGYQESGYSNPGPALALQSTFSRAERKEQMLATGFPAGTPAVKSRKSKMMTNYRQKSMRRFEALGYNVEGAEHKRKDSDMSNNFWGKSRRSLAGAKSRLGRFSVKNIGLTALRGGDSSSSSSSS